MISKAFITIIFSPASVLELLGAFWKLSRTRLLAKLIISSKIINVYIISPSSPTSKALILLAFWHLWSIIKTSYLWYLLSSYSTMLWVRTPGFSFRYFTSSNGNIARYRWKGLMKFTLLRCSTPVQDMTLPKAFPGHWFCQEHLSLASSCLHHTGLPSSPQTMW